MTADVPRVLPGAFGAVDRRWYTVAAPECPSEMGRLAIADLASYVAHQDRRLAEQLDGDSHPSANEILVEVPPPNCA